MAKIDVVSQYCVYNDYPIFRYILEKYRTKLDKIILYPSRHHGVIDLEEWSKKHLPAIWVERKPVDYGVEDWRQAETIPCLHHVSAEWVLFMEQDFFVDDWDKLWNDVYKAMETSDAIGWWNPTAAPYLHPCFLLIKKSVLDKTQKDFRAHSEIPGADHFQSITRDLETIGAKITKLQDLGWENWVNAFHLGGLTYVYQDWKGDGTDHFGVGNPEAFYVYNYWSMQAPVFNNSVYLELAKEVGKTLEQRFPLVNPEDSKWTKFFKLWHHLEPKT